MMLKFIKDYGEFNFKWYELVVWIIEKFDQLHQILSKR
jgi:hypothetical protein